MIQFFKVGIFQSKKTRGHFDRAKFNHLNNVLQTMSKQKLDSHRMISDLWKFQKYRSLLNIIFRAQFDSEKVKF